MSVGLSNLKKLLVERSKTLPVLSKNVSVISPQTIDPLATLLASFGYSRITL